MLIIKVNFEIKQIFHKLIFINPKRVTCNLCPRSRTNSQSKGSIQFSVCYHGNGGSSSKLSQLKDKPSHENKGGKSSDSSSRTSRLSTMYYPKLCARHRVPSICSSEATSQYMRKSRRTTSYASNNSDLASSVDINEFKSKSARFYSRRNTQSSSSIISTDNNKVSSRHLRVPSRSASGSTNESNIFKRNLSSFDKPYTDDEKQKQKLLMVNEQSSMDVDIVMREKSTKNKSQRENGNRVHFHLNSITLTSTDEEDELPIEKVSFNNKPTVDLNEDKNEDAEYQNNTNVTIQEIPNESTMNNDAPLKPIIENSGSNNQIPASKPINIKQSPTGNKQLMLTYEPGSTNPRPSNKNGAPLEWDNDPYWDNLELNAVGKINS